MATYDAPQYLLDKLKCALCYEYLSYPPIKLYAETGSVCGRCPVLEAEKNIEPMREESYERVASILTFPCRYRSQGCMDNLSMKTIPKHEQSCSFKPYFCPILPLGNCPWQGSPSELHGHFATNHQVMLLESSVFELDVINNYKEHYLLPTMGQLFLIRTEFHSSDEIFRCSVHYVGPSELAEKFEYEMTFTTQDDNLSWSLPKKVVEPDVDFLLRINESTVSLPSLREILQEPSTITCKVGIEMISLRQQPMITIGSGVGEENKDADSDSDSESDEDINFSEDKVDKMLLDIECPVCQEFMIPPIFQCVIGHSICGICRPQLKECPTCREKIENTRNFTLEKITENIKYHCKNRFEGCMFVTNSASIRKHEKECKFSPKKCPLDDTLNCDWSGNVKRILSHVKSEHKDYVQTSPYCDMRYNSNCISYELMKVMAVHGEIFRIRYFYCNETRQISCTVQCIASSMEASNFMYEIHIVDVNNIGLQLMSKKYCGSLEDDKDDIKHCTMWHLDMIVPFMSSNDKLLKMKCIISKA